jgi:hypothetical protein
MTDDVRCDCSYCLKPITEWTGVCPHCAKEISNLGLVLGNPARDLAEVSIKLGMWTVGFSIAICSVIIELNLPVLDGDWVRLLVCFIALMISCLFYNELPPETW